MIFLGRDYEIFILRFDLYLQRGYFNPAITLGLVITQTIRVPLAVGFFVAQVLGGMLGAALVRVSMT